MVTSASVVLVDVSRFDWSQMIYMEVVGYGWSRWDLGYAWLLQAQKSRIVTNYHVNSISQCEYTKMFFLVETKANCAHCLSLESTAQCCVSTVRGLVSLWGLYTTYTRLHWIAHSQEASETDQTDWLAHSAVFLILLLIHYLLEHYLWTEGFVFLVWEWTLLVGWCQLCVLHCRGKCNINGHSRG